MLNDRHLEIIALYANGYQAKEIASEIYLSKNTIHNYMKVAKQATGTKSVNQLIVWCIAHGYLTIKDDGSVVPTLEPNE